jgi:cytochrome c-type biogenesis protein CcmE
MDVSSPERSTKRRAKFVIGAGVVVVTIVGLIGWAMSRPGSTAFYMTTSELASAELAAARDYRVNGDLVPGSVERDGLVTTFDITDGETAVTITTDAPLPDAFYGEGRVEIVAQGNYDGTLFTATDVFAKCPSKFKARA